MSPEERIEEVLEEHAFVVDPSSRDQPLRCMCQEGRCDEQGWMLRTGMSCERTWTVATLRAECERLCEQIAGVSA